MQLVHHDAFCLSRDVPMYLADTVSAIADNPISVLLRMENSDDLEIRVPDGSLIVSCTVYEI